MANTLTFTPLSPTVGPKPERCGALLANHLQCQRLGEFEMLTSDENGATVSNYQVCLRHKIVMQSQSMTTDLSDQTKTDEVKEVLEGLEENIEEAKKQLESNPGVN